MAASSLCQAALSPPSRGRGSKRVDAAGHLLRLESPPSRGRGSKLGAAGGRGALRGSPPSRGRGSKHFAGRVHPLPAASPPSRGRGSKHDHGLPGAGRGRRLLHGGVDRNLLASLPATATGVASFTGAWIETRCTRTATRGARSPPSRGRGSKPSGGSHAASASRRLLHGGVDRNRRLRLTRHGAGRRLLHGGVDRNDVTTLPRPGEASRLLHGGVDRNIMANNLPFAVGSRLLHGGVDRNRCSSGRARP